VLKFLYNSFTGKMLGQYCSLIILLIVNGSFIVWRSSELVPQVSPVKIFNGSDNSHFIESDVIAFYSADKEKVILALSIVSFLFIFVSQMCLFVGFRYDRNDFLGLAAICCLIDMVMLSCQAVLAYKVGALFLFYATLSKPPLLAWFGYFLYLCRVVEVEDDKSSVEMVGFGDGDNADPTK